MRAGPSPASSPGTDMTLPPPPTVWPYAAPGENENGFELMTELRRRTDAHLIAIVREEAADAAAKRLADIGAFIVTKPVFKSSLMQAIRFCETHADNETIFRRRIAELEQQAEQNKKLNRAKLIVMTKEQISEDEAHRRIQKLAMDLRVTPAEVAEDIINGLLIWQSQIARKINAKYEWNQQIDYIGLI